MIPIATITSAMGLVRHHYERAFEAYLRAKRMPYVSVNEAHKALLPGSALSPRLPTPPNLRLADAPRASPPPPAIKNFDFILYGQQRNLLIDVKGRQMAPQRTRLRLAPALTALGALTAPTRPPPRSHALARQPRLESWVTEDDLTSMKVWEDLFGQNFAAAFIFMYWCPRPPPDGLYQEVLEHDGRWYAIRGVLAADYAACCKQRSAKWRTIDVPAHAFERISHPFGPVWAGLRGAGSARAPRSTTNTIAPATAPAIAL